MGTPGPPTTVEELRELQVFKGLPDWQIAWFCENAELTHYEVGEIIVTPGQEALHMFVITRGQVAWQREVGGQWLTARRSEVGVASGLLPYSRMTSFPGVRVRVTEPTRVLSVHKSRFQEMLNVSPELGQRLVSAMSDRVRSQTRYQEQEEKMAALGRLSAGLSHELNNPAAAARRSAAELLERLSQLPDRVSNLMRHDLTHEQVRLADTLRSRADGRKDVADMSALDRSEREDEITAWMEDRGVDNAWEISDAFVEAGVTSDDLEEVAAGLPEGAVGDLLTWVEGELVAHRMLNEISSATSRISELVGAVKSYSHVDRSREHKPTDVREGLDTTLTMLGHKIKQKSIRVERVYENDLPQVMANSGELNQVWTNLLDNAIDAVEEGGVVRLEAQSHEGGAIVSVIDHGPGIPLELQSKIFEPFFTTKEVGSGTGLGLDIVQRILTAHNSRLLVDSEPGRTAMRVQLAGVPKVSD